MKANTNIARFMETIDRLSLEGKNVPGLLLSRPGFGKTTTVELWCKYKDYNCYTLIPSRYGADDVVGLQSVDGGKLHRLTPSWYNNLCETAKNGKRNVLFVDEITTCDPYIQGPLLDLIFSHSLGEGHKLPENILVVAAGNYSSDLNNVFKMSAPLVNRFEILNLSNDDYDIFELLENNISSLNTREDIANYLEIESDNDTVYDFNRFKNWVSTTPEVKFGKSEVTEDENIGMLGFTSVRSITYTMMFVQNYMSHYNDDLWIRVAGDTLGVSSKRDGKPMRDVLNTFKEEFLVGINDERTLSEVCDDILSCKKIMKSDLAQLEHIIKSTPMSEMSEGDYAKFIQLVKTFKNNESVVYLAETMKQKVITENRYTEI